MTQEYLNLLSQRKTLQALIAETPEEDVIDRHSLQSRLDALSQKIQQTATGNQEATKVRLTFNGRPVIGSHGIFADFASQAITAFTETITTVAASLNGDLAGSGPLPNRNQNQLLITNTALGSFGFEFQEANSAAGEESAVAIALNKTQNIFQSTTKTDDELTDSIADMHPRAMEKIRNFLSTLATNESVCSLQIKDKVFRFQSVAQVQTSLDRISTNNISEVETTFRGAFIGALPGRRSFEFKVEGDDEVTFIGTTPPEPAILDRINHHLYSIIAVKMLVTTVGNGKPRYVLLEEPAWNDQEGT